MGDFSRDSNDPRKHYSGVLQQQGRVQLDADANEQLAIQLHRTETEAIDTIGHCGVPQEGGGFQIGLTPNALDLTISPGRIYVEGLMCELDATPVPITFTPNAANKAAVESLYVDGGLLKVGQWVELSAAGKTGTKLLQIVAVDAQQNSLTFDTNILDFNNFGPAAIRRVATLLTQPDDPGPNFTVPFKSVPPGQAPAPVASPPKSPLASPPKSPVTSPPKSPLGSPLASPPNLPADGLYLAYIDVWKREITALDDPHIREVALGGPDTATRLKNVWQVKLLPVKSPAGSPVCDVPFAEWTALTAPPSGRMNARTGPPQDQKDPCLLPPTAGFTRLENQLYRVEVQRGGPRQTATFKWSRDNAVVRTTITDSSKAASGILVVADVGRDEVLSFAGGQWVEITDEESLMSGQPRQLVQIAKVDPTTREVTLTNAPAGSLAGRTNLQLVRWDQTGASATVDGVAMTNDWFDLEAGIQVHFSAGTYRAGDYWLIPARVATGEIEWPPFAVPNTNPAPQPPRATAHYFCRLALVNIKGGIINITDCRDLFPPLTHICAEDVCFDNTTCSLPGATNVQQALDMLCQRGDSSPGIHVTAVDLIGGKKLRNDYHVPTNVLAQGIRVTCDHELLATTVQGKPTCYLTIFLPFPLNSQDIQLWQASSIGTQPFILSVEATVDRNMIIWLPGEVTGPWLRELFQRLLGNESPQERLLATLTLKGNFIWAKDNPNLYLDGNVFGAQVTPSPPPGGSTTALGNALPATVTTDLRLPSGDGKRGGDFEMWFWLVEPLELRLVILPSIVTAGGKVTGTLLLNRPAPPGGIVITVDVQDARITDPPPVTIPEGSDSANFGINIPLSFAPTATVSVSAVSDELFASSSMLVNDLRPTLSLNPTSLFAGDSASGLITLNRPAPPGGVQIQVTGTPAGELKITPPVFTIPENVTNAQFSVQAIRSHNNNFNVAVRGLFVAAPNVFNEKVVTILAVAR